MNRLLFKKLFLRKKRHGRMPRKPAKNPLVKPLKSIDKLFLKYADEQSEIIDPKGFETLCADLRMDHSDIELLLLAWLTGTEKQGYFTKVDWERGLLTLGAASISKLRKELAKLKEEVLEPLDFMDFYEFAFCYQLTEERQKTLDIEISCGLLDLVLGSLYRPQVDSFVKFLTIQNDYKVISKDQWICFLQFCRKMIKFPDVDDYDASEAWPILLNNFVEWIKSEKEKEAEEQRMDAV